MQTLAFVGTRIIPAATFGVAMTSLYAAPELYGQLTPITISPVEGGEGVLNLNGLTQTFSAPGTAFQINGATIEGINGGNPISFAGYNNELYLSFVVLGGAGFPNFPGGGGISSIGLVEPGSEFDGSGLNGPNVSLTLDNIFTRVRDEGGIQFIGFLAGGELGYFGIDLGTPGVDQDVNFFPGEILLGSTPTSTITIPTAPTTLPEPSGVGLAALALGAVGIRRHRKATASAA